MQNSKISISLFPLRSTFHLTGIPVAFLPLEFSHTVFKYSFPKISNGIRPQIGKDPHQPARDLLTAELALSEGV